MDIERLIAELSEAIFAVTEQYAAGLTSLDQWQRNMAGLLRRYAETVFAESGLGITPAVRLALDRYLTVQQDFLEAFTNELAARGYQGAADMARAQLYADSLYQPASFADVLAQAGRPLPLPALPGEGSQCVTRCRCKWEIVTLDETAGDYDAYWRLEPGARHCQTCIERAVQWNPLQIRGRVVL